uniref:Uncharacterized protein n=1 Tax=Arundo donax TaxID=35708 RepID=A0A0A9B1Z6_ARUDO
MRFLLSILAHVPLCDFADVLVAFEVIVIVYGRFFYCSMFRN